jgi:uncharacterized protein
MRGVCGWYYLIEADGSVYPCDFYVLDEWKIGNIRTDDLDEMRRAQRSIDFVESSKKLNNACADCKWARLCGGGCRRLRKSPTAPENSAPLYAHCRSHKEFFPYAIEKMQKIAQIEQGSR